MMNWVIHKSKSKIYFALVDSIFCIYALHSTIKMSLISIANSFLCENRAENGNKVTSAKESSLSFFYTVIKADLYWPIWWKIPKQIQDFLLMVQQIYMYFRHVHGHFSTLAWNIMSKVFWSQKIMMGKNKMIVHINTSQKQQKPRIVF